MVTKYVLCNTSTSVMKLPTTWIIRPKYLYVDDSVKKKKNETNTFEIKILYENRNEYSFYPLLVIYYQFECEKCW